MRADCEVRVGTVSEGMSRLARLVLLQRKIVCLRGFILKLRFHVGLSSYLCVEEDDKSLGQRFWVIRGHSARGQRSLPYQPVKALTLEGNRGVRQIKQPYPVAAVCSCTL